MCKAISGLVNRYLPGKQLHLTLDAKLQLAAEKALGDNAGAVVAIDVNSGKMSSEQGVEATATKTNLEAAKEVGRQLRLRDLGGLVVIDFIDMREPKHRLEVERTLKNVVKQDKARAKVGRISRFGLMEMSRLPVPIVAAVIGEGGSDEDARELIAHHLGEAEVQTYASSAQTGKHGGVRTGRATDAANPTTTAASSTRRRDTGPKRPRIQAMPTRKTAAIGGAALGLAAQPGRPTGTARGWGRRR